MIPVACLSRVVFSVGVVALLGSLAVPAHAVTIDWVTVGNPGNAADTAPAEYGAAPSSEGNSVGFRLASLVAVPDPPTYAMALAGLTCGGSVVFRRRRVR